MNGVQSIIDGTIQNKMTDGVLSVNSLDCFPVLKSERKITQTQDT